MKFAVPFMYVNETRDQNIVLHSLNVALGGEEISCILPTK